MKKMKKAQDRKAFPPRGATPREDVAAVMKFYDLPRSFPKNVVAEAKRAAAGSVAEAARGRMDLRGRFVFTCDPVTARDYDDALSIETRRDGSRVLGVHIADVSHYVRYGGALDREARKRSTSVYFPGRVVPMLPEALCDGACSLLPGEDRLAFSVFMTFDKSGRCVGSRFAKSVIRSSARFTYEQVMDVLSGGALRGGPEGPQERKRRERAIRAIGALAQQLRARRFALGALDLEIPEAEVLLDGGGEMTGLELRPYDASHQMVEECMVAANEAVARELWTKGTKILARLHEAPDPERLEELRADLRGMGLVPGDLANRKAFAKLMQDVKGHPLYSTMATAILRSMKRAVYDSRSIGHFGLAKRHYAHFTSPIRRYPDLVLHRQLAAHLAGGDERIPPAELARLADHANAREEIATEAERAAVEIKKYRFVEAQISSRRPVEYDAAVSKCTPFGCFVDIPALALSGLVHVSALSDRYVRFDAADGSLCAPGGGRWRAGDAMKVVASRVDFAQRRIDFVPVAQRRGKAKRRA